MYDLIHLYESVSRWKIEIIFPSIENPPIISSYFTLSILLVHKTRAYVHTAQNSKFESVLESSNKEN